MDFDEYQQKALATAIYPHPIVYPTLGLTGEAGEGGRQGKESDTRQSGRVQRRAPPRDCQRDRRRTLVLCHARPRPRLHL